MGISDLQKLVMELYEKKDVEALIKLLKHKDSSIRWESVEALRRIGSKRAVESLIQSLKDENSDVRKSTALALWEIKREIEPLQFFLLKKLMINKRDKNG